MQGKRTSVLSDMSLLFLCLLFSLGVNAGDYNHVYFDNENVTLWMKLKGPRHTQQVNYDYFSLTYCSGPKDIADHYGDNLLGVDTTINFKVDIPSTPYCHILLSKEKQEALINAVKNKYWHPMYLDGLSLCGILGEVEETKNEFNYYIWTHKKFEIGYNGKQIVNVNLTQENKVNLLEVERIQFTYEVIWKKSSIKFQDRVDPCSDRKKSSTKFQDRANQLSDTDFIQFHFPAFCIFMIFVMIMCWIAFFSLMFMRMLLKDFAGHSKGKEFKDDLGNQKSTV